MIYNELQILGQGEEMLCAHHVRRHVILEDVITPVVTPLCLVTRGPFLKSPESSGDTIHFVSQERRGSKSYIFLDNVLVAVVVILLKVS